MLIGIDMLGVQSPEGRDRESGRYGRQLVRALLARDPVNRYVLYVHEGLPTDQVPSGRNAVRVSIAPATSGRFPRRTAIQRILDQDPDGLDWLILLDPLEPSYGRLPPEVPLQGPKVASILHDFRAAIDDDRRLVPLRRHDALLAVSEPMAAEARRRMGIASPRVTAIGLASDATFTSPGAAEPLTKVSGNELGRMGIRGSFVLAGYSGGSSGADFSALLHAYRGLPIEQRQSYQLVVTGDVGDPSILRSTLREQGAEEGLVLVGEVAESTLATLYGRCSAFLAPTPESASGLPLVEAMHCGAPIVASESPSAAEILHHAGLVADSSGQSTLSDILKTLLSDAQLQNELRSLSIERSRHFGFDTVVDTVVATLGGSKTSGRRARFRVDPAPVVRPRIAVFAGVPFGASSRIDLAAQVPAEWRENYAVDLYLDPGLSSLADGLPTEFGGFDARLFDRNDAIIGYHAVIYYVSDAYDLESKLGRLAKRPGLVFLSNEGWLDSAGLPGVDPSPDTAITRLNELFQTGCRVAVPSPRLRKRITECLPEFVGQLVEIPDPRSSGPDFAGPRTSARSRLDLLPDSLVIGLFGRPDHSASSPTIRKTMDRVIKAIPQVIVLASDHETTTPDEMISVLDLAIELGGPDSSTLPWLLKAGIPTIVVHETRETDLDFPVSWGDPDGWLEVILRLASDPEARSTLSHAALAYCHGAPDPSRTSALLLEEVERCAREIASVPGRRRRATEATPGLVSSPHFPRPAMPKGEVSSRSR